MFSRLRPLGLNNPPCHHRSRRRCYRDHRHAPFHLTLMAARPDALFRIGCLSGVEASVPERCQRCKWGGGLAQNKSFCRNKTSFDWNYFASAVIPLTFLAAKRGTGAQNCSCGWGGRGGERPKAFFWVRARNWPFHPRLNLGGERFARAFTLEPGVPNESAQKC